MIGRLSGVIISKQPPSLLLDINGVGYEIDAPMSTFYHLPEVGEGAVLCIHTHVREDALQLYGFASDAERSLFRALIKVSGIGAKLALTILSGISVADFVHCVQSENSAALTRLPGVGKKTAERLLIEMRDKLGAKSVLLANQRGVFVSPVPASPVEEAVTALIALGYKPNEASRMVREVQGAEQTEEFIRLALQAAIKR